MDLKKIICILAVVVVLLVGFCVYGEVAIKHSLPNAEMATEQSKEEESTAMEEQKEMAPTEGEYETVGHRSCEEDGHVWGEITYTWINEDGACEAKRACEECTKIETETAAAQYSGEGESLGVKVEFQNPEFEAQSKEKDIAGTKACFIASNAVGKPGDTVEVALVLQNNPGIVALALQVGYDAEKLELIEVRDNGLMPNAMFANSFSKNPYYVSWNDALGQNNFTGDGTLATMVFRIREQAALGGATVSLSYSPGDVINWDLEKQLFATVNGTVTITENVPGETMFPIPQDPTLKTS